MLDPEICAFLMVPRKLHVGPYWYLTRTGQVYMDAKISLIPSPIKLGVSPIYHTKVARSHVALLERTDDLQPCQLILYIKNT